MTCAVLAQILRTRFERSMKKSVSQPLTSIFFDRDRHFFHLYC
jgi:hypothetical protein